MLRGGWGYHLLKREVLVVDGYHARARARARASPRRHHRNHAGLALEAARDQKETHQGRPCLECKITRTRSCTSFTPTHFPKPQLYSDERMDISEAYTLNPYTRVPLEVESVGLRGVQYVAQCVACAALTLVVWQ